MRKIMVSIVIAIGIFAFICQAAGQSESMKTETLSSTGKVTVKGILLNNDRSPAFGKQVFVLESIEKGKFMLAFGADGKIANQAMVGEKGTFSVSVERAFLESRQAVLCVLLQSGITPQYPNGTPLIVKSPKDSNVVDLGEIIITYE